MNKSRYDHYLETEILSADPVKLVNLLYRGAIEAVVEARRHLATGKIQERSSRIMKAWDILAELSRALDHSHAGLSAKLQGLYVYMQQRLLDANMQQSDQPLGEVEELLVTLSSAWRSLPTPKVEQYESVSVAG